MKKTIFRFEEANQNLVWILAIGLALGIANYALGIWPTFGQSLVQQVVISLVIGYGLVFIAYNYDAWLTKNSNDFKKYGLLIFLFGCTNISIR